MIAARLMLISRAIQRTLIVFLIWFRPEARLKINSTLPLLLDCLNARREVYKLRINCEKFPFNLVLPDDGFLSVAGQIAELIIVKLFVYFCSSGVSLVE